jgi:ribosomal protein L11 methyltransferase
MPRSIPSVWVWRRLVPLRLADAWVERVRWAASSSPILQEFPGKPTARLEVYGERADAARALKKLFGGEVRPVPAKSWLTPQARDFVLALPGALVLAAEAATIPARHQALPELRIPAGMAFGTGEHATTALCLRQLAIALKSRRAVSGTETRRPVVIDAGTGSGVLALAAAAMGAETEAFDFDPVCMRECRANAARNPHIPSVRWRRADVLRHTPAARADVVVANLFSELLIRALPRLKRWIKPGGILILSGVLRHQEAAVATALARHGLQSAKVLRKGKWVCFAGVRPRA